MHWNAPRSDNLSKMEAGGVEEAQPGKIRRMAKYRTTVSEFNLVFLPLLTPHRYGSDSDGQRGKTDKDAGHRQNA